jgi:hypothetical protein
LFEVRKKWSSQQVDRLRSSGNMPCIMCTSKVNKEKGLRDALWKVLNILFGQ